MSHVLYPTELLRWHNEPPAPNGTRRAMLSLSAPDRYAEPEPLFEPRSRYSGDERRSGGRRDSFGTSRTRHFRPGGAGWSVTGHRHAAPWAGVCIRSGAAGRSKMSELSKSIPGARASRFGATKNPGQATCLPGFRVRETGGGCFFRGPPGRCSGDLPHEHTAHGLHSAERARSAITERRHRHCPATRPACSIS